MFRIRERMENDRETLAVDSGILMCRDAVVCTQPNAAHISDNFDASSLRNSVAQSIRAGRLQGILHGNASESNAHPETTNLNATSSSPHPPHVSPPPLPPPPSRSESVFDPPTTLPEIELRSTPPTLLAETMNPAPPMPEQNSNSPPLPPQATMPRTSAAAPPTRPVYSDDDNPPRRRRTSPSPRT